MGFNRWRSPEASDRPVLENQTRDAAEVTGVSGDQGATMLQDGCGNPKILPADIKTQANQLL
jgi:hypothetical protein